MDIDLTEVELLAKVGEKVEQDIFRNIYEEDKEVVINKDGVEGCWYPKK